MASVRAAGRTIWNQRKRIVLVLTPVILSPLLIKVQTAAASCAYAVLIISIYWMAEVFPMAVTALLPVLLFPLLGIMHSSRVSANYMKDIIMTMIGAFFVADALAYWDLHRRFALKILLYTASSPRWLMFGLMATTSFLAMWMSNSVVTAMMVPLTIAILKEIDTKRKETKHSGMENGAVIVERTEEGIEIKEYNSVHDYDKSTEEVEALRKSRDSDPTGDEAFTRLSKGMVLCVAYAANIGGTATLYGTSSNIVMTGQLESLYGYEAVIDFGTWFLYAFPNQLIILLFAWFVLQWRFLDLRGILKNCRCGFSTCCSKTTKKESDAQLVIREQYEAMGSMSWAEVVVLIHFVVLSLLWLSYSPRFIPGWASIFDHGYVTATTATIAVVVSLCLFPAKRPAFLKCGNGSATHIIQGR
ncbi:Na(+)/dicarboxylate cotransporter 3-like [Saccoglossus kowalevskii]